MLQIEIYISENLKNLNNFVDTNIFQKKKKNVALFVYVEKNYGIGSYRVKRLTSIIMWSTRLLRNPFTNGKWYFSSPA